MCNNKPQNIVETTIKDFLENKHAMHLYDDLIKLFRTHEFGWKIFRQMERDYHKEDVLNEIEDMLEYENYDEPQIEITDDIIEQIVDRYEDNLSNDDGWHVCLRNAIDWVVYDEF
mgnify:CR=1 FL=1